MKEVLNKDIAKELMEVEGETRGFNIKLDGEYILKTKGKEGLRKLEKELETLGYPIEYQKLKNMTFVPAGLRAISLLAIKKTFGVDDEEIRRVGAFHPKTSLVVRLFAKYFYSIPRIMEKAQNMWKTYWTVGNFKFIEFNEKERYAILRIEGFDLHPVFCTCEEGYFASISELVLGKKNITCKETECSFKGDKYHEFLIKWED